MQNFNLKFCFSVQSSALSQTTYFKISLGNFESESEMKVGQSCLTLCHPMYSSPWNFPGQNTGVGSLSLLQGIFPTQELNQDLLHCRWILYQLSYQGSPWVTLDSALLSVSPSDSNDYLL